MLYSNLTSYINSVLLPEGITPSIEFVTISINQALAIMFDESAVYVNSTNLSVTANCNYVELPNDFVSLRYATYLGNKICLASPQDGINDSNLNVITSNVGQPEEVWITGKNLYMYPAPDVSSSNLKIYYNAYPPLYSLTDKDENPDTLTPNPLDFLPTRYQLLPAYYVLGTTPPFVNRDGDGQAVKDNARINLYQTLWTENLKAFKNAGMESSIGIPHRF